MSNFSALKTAIQTAIKQNGNNEITGAILQDILLSIVSTLGDSAINTLEQGLQTLEQAIENEATERGNQDTQLGYLITGIKNNIDNGYVYAGIATPSTTPVSGKVFYIATQAGTYTNLGNTAVKPGISILKYNGSSWSNEQVIYTDDGVFDVSAYNGGATYASLEALLSDANLSTIIPSVVRKGGMSIKFIQTSDNKYVQYRLMNNTWSTTEADWQGVDDELLFTNTNIASVGSVKKGIIQSDKTILSETFDFYPNGISTSNLGNVHSIDDIHSLANDNRFKHAVIEANLNDIFALKYPYYSSVYCAYYLLDENFGIVTSSTGNATGALVITDSLVRYLVVNVPASGEYICFKSKQSYYNRYSLDFYRPTVLQIALNTAARKFTTAGTTTVKFFGSDLFTIASGTEVDFSAKGNGWYDLVINQTTKTYEVKDKFTNYNFLSDAYIWCATFIINGSSINIIDTCLNIVVDDNKAIKDIVNTVIPPYIYNELYKYEGIKYIIHDNDLIAGKRINATTGELESNANYKTSNLISVVKGDVIVAKLVTSSTPCLAAYRDNEGTVVYDNRYASLFPVGVTTIKVTIPDNVDYIRYSYKTGVIDDPFIIIRNGNTFENVSHEVGLPVDEYKSIEIDEFGHYYVKDYANGNIIKHYIGETEIKGRQEFNIENEQARGFLHSFIYDSNDYSYTYILDYKESPTSLINHSNPLPAYVSIDKNFVVPSIVSKTIVETYKGNELFRTDEFDGLQNIIPIFNLIPCEEYKYVIKYKDTNNMIYRISKGVLYTIGQFRAIYVDGMYNFRDIGGYPTLDGKRIKYGKLYRSGELQSSTPSQGNITAKGINEVINNLGINVEIDFGDYASTSPIESYVDFLHGDNYSVGAYSYLNVANIIYTIRQIITKLNADKTILFHCNEGCDRTGTFAFVVEAILGVCESDLAKDYELSSLYFYARQRNGVYADTTPPAYDTNYGYGAYRSMIEYIKSTYTGDTINDKVTNMLIGGGITQSEINEFKSLMLED